MTGITLYQIASEHRQMVETLMDIQADPQTIEDTISAESYPLELKAQNTAYAIKTLDANADAIEAAAKEMLDRAKALRNRAKHVKDYLLRCMDLAGVKKIECPHFALSLRDNPAAVEVFDEKQVPQDYMREIPARFEVDKALIKQAIKDGYEVPGAKLTQGKRLEIK
jgi:hypothetical protein